VRSSVEVMSLPSIVRNWYLILSICSQIKKSNTVGKVAQ
jgi:hypothetical protein